MNLKTGCTLILRIHELENEGYYCLLLCTYYLNNNGFCIMVKRHQTKSHSKLTAFD